MQNQRTRAFTLIELLVVIAIIAILAAILFPVFAKARERAKMSACLSNMKQIGTALSGYGQDYDEKYPPTRLTQPYVKASPSRPGDPTWKDAISGWVRSIEVYRCPSNTYAWTTGSAYPVPGDETGRYPRSYATNGGVFPNDNKAVPISQFKTPSETLLIVESRWPHSNQWVQGAGWPILSGDTFKSTDMKKGAFNTHIGAISIWIFADTHVQALRYKQTLAPRTMWPATAGFEQDRYTAWTANSALMEEYW